MKNLDYHIFIGKCVGYGFSYLAVMHHKDQTSKIHYSWPSYMRAGGHTKVMVF